MRRRSQVQAKKVTEAKVSGQSVRIECFNRGGREGSEGIWDCKAWELGTHLWSTATTQMEMISSPSCVMKPSSSLKSFPAWTGVRCQPELLAGNRNFQACLQPEMTRLLAGNRTIPAGKMPTSNWKSPFSFWKCHYFQPDWCSLPAGNCFILAGLCPASQPEMFFLAGFCPNFQREITSFMLYSSPFPARNHFFHAGLFSVPSQKSLFFAKCCSSTHYQI